MTQTSVSTHGEIAVELSDAEGHYLIINVLEGCITMGEHDRQLDDGEYIDHAVDGSMAIDLHGLKMLKTWLEVAIPGLERFEAFKATRQP